MAPTLPGGTRPQDLVPGVGRFLGTPVDDLEVGTVEPVAHVATAPTTAGLFRVALTARSADGARTPVRLVAKVLRPARHGLPPQMHDEARAHLDRTIPWRLEADVVSGLRPERFPPGLGLPALVALSVRDDEATLWQQEVAVDGAPWTGGDVVQAAGLLGRLAARRAHDPVPWGGPTFLRSFLDDAVRTWAVPLLRGSEAWQHPEFAAAVGRGLEEPVRALMADVASDDGPGVAPLAAVPALPSHGDPTPDNLLRPASDPSSFVLIDWASATCAPAGWDVVPLVFGPAEAGRAPAEEAVAVLSRAVAAYGEGLALEGHPVDPVALRAAVRAMVRLRYGITVLPLDALAGGRTRSSSRGRQADLVAAVLGL